MRTFAQYVIQLSFVKKYFLCETGSSVADKATPLSRTRGRSTSVRQPLFAEVLNCLRGRDLNPRPSGYEPDVALTFPVSLYFRLEERFQKTDIGLSVPFAISLPLFLFRSDPQSSLLFSSSAAK